MTRRSKSRHKLRRSGEFPIGWAIAGGLFVVALVAGFGWLYFQAAARNPALAEDWCPLTGPTEQVLVLVDVTDALADVTQIDLINGLTELARNVRRGGRFELRVLEPG